MGEIVFDESALVYFTVASHKEGGATFVVEHNPTGQVLRLPVYPTNTVDEALPFLHSESAHYAAQWKKIMVDDPEVRDAHGFPAPAHHLPNGILPEGEVPNVVDVVVSAGDSAIRTLFDEVGAQAVFAVRDGIAVSNVWQFVRDITVFNEFDITLLA